MTSSGGSETANDTESRSAATFSLVGEVTASKESLTGW